MPNKPLANLSRIIAYFFDIFFKLRQRNYVINQCIDSWYILYIFVRCYFLFNLWSLLTRMIAKSKRKNRCRSRDVTWIAKWSHCIVFKTFWHQKPHLMILSQAFFNYYAWGPKLNQIFITQKEKNGRKKKENAFMFSHKEINRIKSLVLQRISFLFYCTCDVM